MCLYEVTAIHNKSRLVGISASQADIVGKKGYFTYEVGFDMCFMFSYRNRGDSCGFISAPVNNVNGIPNMTDLVVSAGDTVYNFNVVKNEKEE